MARIRKTKEEIYKLIVQYQQIFQYYKNNKLTIPKPRLTPTLSESLVYHLIEDKIILKNLAISSVNFSSSGGDLVVLIENNEKTVEVKSTGVSAFQYFSPKDLNADFLICIYLRHLEKHLTV